MREGEFWSWKADLQAALETGGHVEDCAAQGDCEEACREALADREIAVVMDDGLSKGALPRIIHELLGTGAWERGELEADRTLTLVRFIWILCGDIREGDR